MPSKSKSQQRFFGMADAVKKGELDPEDVGKSVRDAAKDMTMKQVRDFASTKTKGLPEKVKKNKHKTSENMKRNSVRLTESQLHNIIRESVRRIIRENEEGENVPYDAWSKYLGGKEPVFEFEGGIIYVDYDENDGTLCSGGVTNVGFHKDGEVEVPVYDGDFQSALEEVYDQLCTMHEPLD